MIASRSFKAPLANYLQQLGKLNLQQTLTRSIDRSLAASRGEARRAGEFCARRVGELANANLFGREAFDLPFVSLQAYLPVFSGLLPNPSAGSWVAS